jgi:tRNA(fMet)-specific endonuclease VapC
VLPYDGAAARWHARERARLAKLGRPAPFADGQVAAIAAVNQLVLVTRNVSDVRATGVALLDPWAAAE